MIMAQLPPSDCELALHYELQQDGSTVGHDVFLYDHTATLQVLIHSRCIIPACLPLYSV